MHNESGLLHFRVSLIFDKADRNLPLPFPLDNN